MRVPPRLNSPVILKEADISCLLIDDLLHPFDLSNQWLVLALSRLPHAHVLADVKPTHLPLRRLIYCQGGCRIKRGGTLRVGAVSEEPYASRNSSLKSGRVAEHPCRGLGRMETVIDLIVLDCHMLTRDCNVLDDFRKLAAIAFNDLPHSSALLCSCTATIL